MEACLDTLYHIGWFHSHPTYPFLPLGHAKNDDTGIQHILSRVNKGLSLIDEMITRKFSKCFKESILLR